MDVIQDICQSCGLVTEIVARRHGDYNPLCKGCNQPVRSPKTVTDIGAVSGALQLRMIPRRGLGVFSLVNIHKGNLVERCPAFVLHKISDHLRHTEMLPYTDSARSIELGHLLFPWVEDQARAIVVGYAMLYNHEPKNRSNVRYQPYIDPESSRRFIDFYAKRDIVAGEELTQTYASKEKLWFTYSPGRST